MRNSKIGILTFHRVINYGAFLQSYSLCTMLNEIEGVEAELIDYMPPEEEKKIIINFLWMLKNYGVKGAYQELKKIRAFRKALRKQKLSPKYLLTRNLKKLYTYIDNRYDALVIGSDAVFNWKQNGYPTAFIPDYTFSIPVLTYAASVHGLKYLDEDRERINQCRRFFENVKYIGVRDQCSEAFVNYCCDSVSCHHTCDPTVFLDTEKICAEVDLKRCLLDKPYIVLMLQDKDISRRIYERFKEVYKDSYEIITLFKPNEYADRYLYDLSPFEWVAVLRQASIVITNYFHGALLSYVQGTPAIVVDISKYDDPYEGKMEDLLKRRLHLEGLYYKKADFSEAAFENSGMDKLFAVIEQAFRGDFDSMIVDAIRKEKESTKDFVEVIRGL